MENQEKYSGDVKMKSPLIEKIENFWYYHKWMIIFGVIVIAFISICVAQYASKSEAYRVRRTL